MLNVANWGDFASQLEKICYPVGKKLLPSWVAKMVWLDTLLRLSSSGRSAFSRYVMTVSCPMKADKCPNTDILENTVFDDYQYVASLARPL